MTYWPLKPQFLAPGVVAPDDAPQTQFISEGDSASKVEAAKAAIDAYEAAQAAGHTGVPPACVADLTPAAELLAEGPAGGIEIGTDR